MYTVALLSSKKYTHYDYGSKHWENSVKNYSWAKIIPELYITFTEAKNMARIGPDQRQQSPFRTCDFEDR